MTTLKIKGEKEDVIEFYLEEGRCGIYLKARQNGVDNGILTIRPDGTLYKWSGVSLGAIKVDDCGCIVETED